MKKMFQLTITLTVIAAIAGVSISSVYEKTKNTIFVQKQAQLNSALESLFPEGAAISEDTIILKDSTMMRFWIAEKTDFMETSYSKSDKNESSEDSTAQEDESNGSSLIASSSIDESILGFAFEAGKFGYSSIVKFIVASSVEGEILGLSVLSQEETPGLGSRVTESVSTSTFWNGLFKSHEKREPWFQSQFRGLSMSDTITVAGGAEWHTLTEDEKIVLQNKNEVTAITGATITTKSITNALLEESLTLNEIAAYLSENGGISDK